MDDRTRRADALHAGVAAFCRAAQGYVDAARFADAIALLRGVDVALGLPEVRPATRALLAASLADAATWQSSLIDLRAFPDAIAAAEQAVGAALSTGDPATLALALLARSRAAYHQFTQAGEGDLAAVVSDADAARDWAAQAGDAPLACAARLVQGLAAERAGEYTVANTYFFDVLTQAEGLGLLAQEAEALRHLGFASLRRRDLDTATQQLAAALNLSEQLGLRYALPFAHLSLGEVSVAQGATRRAWQSYETGLALAEITGNRRAQMQLLASMAELQSADNPAAARTLLERAAAQARELGHAWGLAYIQQQLDRLG